MGPSKRQLKAQLKQLQADYNDLYLENERRKEELRVANLRGDSVFAVSDSAKFWLEGVFGPLTGDFDKSTGVHRYMAEEQLASITFVPITGKVSVADPKGAIASMDVQLSPSGELSLPSAQRITAFLEEVEHSRRARRKTQPKGPIDFTSPAPTVDVGTPSDTPRAATDEEAAEQALDGIKY